MGIEERMAAMVLAGVVVGVLLSSCHSAHMAVPNGLAVRYEPLTCSGRGGFNKDFQFGVYQVTDVHRGWTRRSAWGLWRLERANTQQSFEFSLTAPEGDRWNGQAAAGLQAADLKLRPGAAISPSASGPIKIWWYAWGAAAVKPGPCC
ncbi:hypothetical protein GX408_15155 [bacterium]|nr:hypothetical protein [bacterium]